MSRRRTRVNQLTIISWRDIPAQVTATVDGRTEKALLEPRFQVAIDRAATIAGLTETSAYVAQWQRRSDPLQPGTDPAEAANRASADLNRRYDRSRLEALVASGGLADDDHRLDTGTSSQPPDGRRDDPALGGDDIDPP